jgi:hypothetical protein
MRKHLLLNLVIGLVLLSVPAVVKAAVSIRVDPGAYAGDWWIQGMPNYRTGVQNVSLNPGQLIVQIGVAGAFNINVAADGMVTSLNTAAASGGPATLTFNTTTITVNPGAYTGQWWLYYATPSATGIKSLELVPGVNYQALVGVAGAFNFSVAADGMVTSLNTAAASGGPATLMFNTTTITVNPGTYTGQWGLYYAAPSAAGVRTLALVPGFPGITYVLQVPGQPSQNFSVEEPCAVKPPQLIFGSFTFTITCPITIANAGPDQTVSEGTLVTLDGSGSRAASQGVVLAYTWTQIAGSPVTLNISNPVHPTFTAPFVAVGGETLTFRLIVTEGTRDSEPDFVDIHVRKVNSPPVADAGPDQTVDEGSLVMLNGSNSYDPNGETITFSWVQTDGPAVSLLDTHTATPSFSAPMVGAVTPLKFQLTVRDNIVSATDSVTVNVEHVNHPPVANAGPDQTRDEGTLVTLNGMGSIDPDGDVISYSWSQTAGPLVALSDANSPTPSFTAPPVSAGGTTLTFRLSVSDGFLSSNTDDVDIKIVYVNDPPACDLAQPTLTTLWPPDHKMVPVGIVNVSDPNNDQISISITGVTQDEPVNGLGDGDTSPDAVLQGDKVLLRAERSGTGNGRVYQVSFTADDGYGSSCTGAVTVCVPHDRRPGTCVDDRQQYNATRP